MQVYCQQKLEAKLQSLHKKFLPVMFPPAASVLYICVPVAILNAQKTTELLCWMNLVPLQDANYDFVM